MKLYEDWVDWSPSLLIFKSNIFLISSFNFELKVPNNKQFIVSANAKPNKGEIVKLDTNVLANQSRVQINASTSSTLVALL